MTTRLPHALLATLILSTGACAPEGAGDDALTTRESALSGGTTGLLRSDGKALPCADPTVFSKQNLKATYYVYCTSMSHVFRTSDWTTFTDVRDDVSFNNTGLPENGKKIGSWWAPSIVYAPGANRYVMMVSVPDGQGEIVDGRWDTRSIAVFFSSSPTGPWTFQRIALDAAKGDLYIDPELFLSPRDGGHFVYWKQYGKSVNSRIAGSRLSSDWTTLQGARAELLNGYGGAGSWEDNVRENPAMLYRAGTDTFQLLWSGGHWFDHTYATGHSISDSPLTGFGFRVSGDRGVEQVVQARDLTVKFANGGPGGAVWQDDEGLYIVYAAAAQGRADDTRYLLRERVTWQNGAPYVDNAKHHPSGF